MNDALMYFLKVNIAIALFYIFYRLFFAGDTFWKTRRYYLVFSVFLSAVYPLISLSGWLEKQEPMQAIMANYVQLQGITVNSKPTSNFTVENILLALYALVSLVLLVRMVVQLGSILRWKMRGETLLLQGTKVVKIETKITPFSFFHAIFINPTLHTELETKQILTHELTHARQLHSLDVLLSEILTIVCWFNPAAWMLKREIRQNLEFLADNNVLESGFDSKNYQYHLLQLSYQVPNVTLVNKFNVLPLKKRIIMMNQQKTNKAGLLKYSLIVPLALALVLSSNAETLVSTAKKAFINSNETKLNQKKSEDNQSSTTIQPVKSNEPQVGDNKVYTVVEKMPQYPGGEKGLIEYLTQSIRYPVEAQKNNQQGVTIVRFVVNADGKVVNSEILRSISSSLDQEALRVVNAMKDWVPGEQNGKKVSVYYTLPITFKLDDGTNSISSKKKGLVVVGYGKQASDLEAPKVKEIDPKNPPVFVVDGNIKSKDFDVKIIKPETIESINVIKADSEKRKAELVAQYGEQATNGVILITMKK
ncbi:MAG: TonB family protein [Paludibacter sp.]|nr:TonB family protein [Paludibacter sp.]